MLQHIAMMVLGGPVHVLVGIVLAFVALSVTALALLASWLAGDLTEAAENDADDAAAAEYDPKNSAANCWLKM
jgi:hypothetical protein